MKFYNVNSPVEQDLIKVLVALRIILDHGINGIIHGKALHNRDGEAYNQNKRSTHSL